MKSSTDWHAVPKVKETMKRSRYSDEQISYALRQAESGTAVAEVSRQLGISDATFYVWKNEVREPWSVGGAGIAPIA